ncbi:MAG: hypothetical protein GY841_18735 [FCB group bacterium]|nr:hypothetical protein [FCB group bacterium]
MKTDIIDINPADIRPTPKSILAAQGIASEADIQPKVKDMATEACRIYDSLAQPIGLIRSITKEQLEIVLEGQGQNDSPNPLEDIYPRAEASALFAVTSGSEVSRKISALFKSHDFALGSLLDTAASEGTDRASRLMEKRFSQLLNGGDSSPTVLAYSPGYCGWHVSAQKVLFDLLSPEQIGITLRDSFLMEPLKSISGVLIAGPKEIHLFDNSFSFCGQCRTQPCLLRMGVLESG